MTRRHRNITQVMGFCKSNIFPSIIFYEDLRPIGLMEYWEIDKSWDTLEDIFTKHRMRHNIRAGFDHIKATIPSVFEFEGVLGYLRIIHYSLKNTARLGIYLGSDNRPKLSILTSAQLCHLNAKLKNERPCKLTSLELVSQIDWCLDVRLGSHTQAAVTWPVDEIFLFIDNPEISENGYIKRPNIYWSRCPQGSTRLTTLELHVFGVEVPQLSCYYLVTIFDFKIHNIKPLQEFYEPFGLDPFSDDVARAAGALLPRHLNLRNSKRKRRHSFTVHRDIIHDRDEFRGGWRKSYHYSPPKNVQILQELSSHLGIRVPVHWQLLAAAEVLPEYLHWYDLRTTGHEFEYGEVNMDPKYDALPSRCRDFLYRYQSQGKSLEEMIRKFWHDLDYHYDYDSDWNSDSA
ncbi:hypothetical protein M422DRAFT_248710 [Sphaerobolus stellatus SS14]|nr:hypothetical protein M422DRAFT_248710 [Sphaerobolus stellatus SS14]